MTRWYYYLMYYVGAPLFMVLSVATFILNVILGVDAFPERKLNIQCSAAATLGFAFIVAAAGYIMDPYPKFKKNCREFRRIIYGISATLQNEIVTLDDLEAVIERLKRKANEKALKEFPTAKLMLWLDTNVKEAKERCGQWPAIESEPVNVKAWERVLRKCSRWLSRLSTFLENLLNRVNNDQERVRPEQGVDPVIDEVVGVPDVDPPQPQNRDNQQQRAPQQQQQQQAPQQQQVPQLVNQENDREVERRRRQVEKEEVVTIVHDMKRAFYTFEKLADKEDYKQKKVAELRCVKKKERYTKITFCILLLNTIFLCACVGIRYLLS